jgi:hypothetical protein
VYQAVEARVNASGHLLAPFVVGRCPVADVSKVGRVSHGVKRYHQKNHTNIWKQR